jgi:hypothetical protein
MVTDPESLLSVASMVEFSTSYSSAKLIGKDPVQLSGSMTPMGNLSVPHAFRVLSSIVHDPVRLPLAATLKSHSST